MSDSTASRPRLTDRSISYQLSYLHVSLSTNVYMTRYVDAAGYVTLSLMTPTVTVGLGLYLYVQTSIHSILRSDRFYT